MPATRLDSLIRLADTTYRTDHDSARRIYQTAHAEATAVGDSASIARALTGIGMAARLDGEYGDSRRIGELALAIKTRLGMGPRDMFRSQNALGLLAWYTGRLRDATSHFDAAGRSALRAKDSTLLSMVTVNLGLVARDQGAFDRSRDLLTRGHDLARAAADSVTLGRALNNLAMLDIALGDPVRAIASIEEARRLARLTGDAIAEVNARGQLATAYIALGEPERAFALLDSALKLAQRAGQRLEATEDLLLIGDLFSEAGDYRHALDYYERAQLATDSLEQPDERANILRSTAQAHAALGNLPLARQSATQALRIHRAAELAHSELNDLVFLADLSQREGRAEEAENHLRAAALLADSLEAPITRVQVALATGRVASSAGNWARVLAAIDSVQGSLTLAGSSAEAEAHALRARALAALGRREAALAAGNRAVEAVERMRTGFAGDELRASYTSARADVYAQQVLLLLQLGKASEAFQVADAARGRALLDHLSQARSELLATRATGTLVEQDALLRRIDALLGQLRERERTPPRERSIDDRAANAELQDSVEALRAAYTALAARNAKTPGDKRAVAGASHPGADAIRASLDPDEVLVEYLVTADRLLTFVVTPSRVDVQDIPARAEDLTMRVQLARRLLRRADAEVEARVVLKALHGIVLEPVARAGLLRGVKRIIVVPHGVLTYLPFGALVDGASYLAERYEFMTLPTSAALPSLRAAVSGPQRERVEVFAPLPKALPSTGREAAVVSGILKGATARIGSDATEARFRAALEQANVVHLATHTWLNSRNPLFSYLELAGGRSRNASDNGRLEAYELFGLRIGPSLVFLSGCETGVGGAWSTSFDTGEDYAALAQTLLYAGARNVVATLWRIDDDGAAEFARHFYEGLRGEAYPAALARAQRQMLRDARYRSPYYWAAYQVTGGGR